MNGGKDLAPSTALRKWFRQIREVGGVPVALSSRTESAGRWKSFLILGERARQEAITMVYAARDEERNNAVVIKRLIENLTGLRLPTRATGGGRRAGITQVGPKKPKGNLTRS